jgi:molybdopterin-guanine dinucleotide biosynthesis protein B
MDDIEVPGTAMPRMAHAKVPLLGFAALSGTGKTTLLKLLIPLLRKEGLRIGLIKHAHHAFEVDTPGKDSFELRQAGASPVMLCSSRRRVIMTDHSVSRDPSLDEELFHLNQTELDLLLVEGFKHEVFPKLELHRPSLGHPLLYPGDRQIMAIATDAELVPAPPIPSLDLNQPQAVADFILQVFLPGARRDVDLR